MSTPVLYYVAGNASLAPHIVLQEIGAPYDLKRVDRDQHEHKSADYLKLNPSGLIPALVDGDLVLTEAAAICLYLADRHPESRLAPALGTPERAQLYKWLMYLTNTLQAELSTYFYPHRLGGESAKGIVQANAEMRAGAMLDIIEKHFADSVNNSTEKTAIEKLGTQVVSPAIVAPAAPQWILGADYSIADAYLMMLCRWTRGFAHPARVRPHLHCFLVQMMARPAVSHVFAQEELLTPPY